jgi:hypothetical protein
MAPSNILDRSPIHHTCICLRLRTGAGPIVRARELALAATRNCSAVRPGTATTQPPARLQARQPRCCRTTVAVSRRDPQASTQLRSPCLLHLAVTPSPIELLRPQRFFKLHAAPVKPLRDDRQGTHGPAALLIAAYYYDYSLPSRSSNIININLLATRVI